MNSLDIAGLLFSAAIFGSLAYVAAAEGIPVARDVARDIYDFVVPAKKEKTPRSTVLAKA